MIKIAPSILSADFLRLGEEIKAVERAGADRFHIDVMDGQFVPNISLGIPVVKTMRRGTSFPLEVHLMIEEPERLLEAFAEAGADILIVHQENSVHLDRTVQCIKDLGKKAGVALNPSTPAAVLEEIIEELNLVLVMTVNPGFGGQHFIEYTVKKIRQVRKMLDSRNPKCELEVDGGIEPQNAPRVVEAGARVLVAGTAVFGHEGGAKAGMEALKKALPRR
ncbi:MAG: ribulose-phosphate 3-epimerase [Thermodesulfobacteriota bacterium]|jgi:ribulose-phosphate 3-epimerase